MRLWSPATAMLWESWRLTWRQLAFFGALASVGGWAMLAGGADNGAPGLRADYSPTYYAAFLTDPDGNNVEAVCME